MNTELIDTTEILIVDDDQSVILALHQVLATLGRVRFAGSGQQALAMVDIHKPSLILMDVELPDINGLEVCRQLKNCPSTADIPVLFITSRAEPSFQEQVFDVGAADFISKPLNPRVVAARSKTHLAYQQALQKLDQQAHTDWLTNIPNRRGLDEQLVKELAQANRKQQSLSLLMIDLDEFKKYNDHFGHQAGDECLKQVAQAIAATCRRPMDYVARFGGEEFAAILPNTDLTGAIAFAEQLRQQLLALQLDHAPSSKMPYLTVSIGVACTDTSDKELTSEDLLKRADTALYDAKRQGRNCVVTAS